MSKILSVVYGYFVWFQVKTITRTWALLSCRAVRCSRWARSCWSRWLAKRFCWRSVRSRSRSWPPDGQAAVATNPAVPAPCTRWSPDRRSRTVIATRPKCTTNRTTHHRNAPATTMHHRHHRRRPSRRTATVTCDPAGRTERRIVVPGNRVPDRLCPGETCSVLFLPFRKMRNKHETWH